MKKIGNQPAPHKVITVTTTVNVMPNEDIFGAPRFIRPPTIQIIIDFMFTVDGKNAYSKTLKMEGRDRDQRDEKLRDEMKQRAWVEFAVFSDAANEAFDQDGWDLVIIDPAGVFEWFGADVAADIFNQTKMINDKPLRLPASGIGSR